MNTMLFSSIARKTLMALAGLFLVTFLCVHLGINLMLLRDDGGETFTSAARFMGTNPFIRTTEIVLFSGFLVHIFFGLWVSVQNRAARVKSYVIGNRSETSLLSKYMFHTGIVVLIFLALHFIDFYFIKIGLVAPPAGIEAHDFYHRTLLLFSSPIYSAFYIVSFLFLGFHLNHAFQSAFQTLGLNHTRYMGAVRFIGSAYSVFITAGFSLVPLYIYFFK
ncbi:MAG: succinate dehydrogenase cytochrome b subunit [Chlorobiaceae bacterium]|nr:succinate dehydrogenase cytochrome b subunit [Chlorobiaceae bacterium]NTV59978.1 succinate dehydrogenase cytochrome b subunit [Chlorobiaceae bacterium]